MLLNNHLIGFGAGGVTLVSSLISQSISGATNIGDCTLNGGLAALFDNNTAQGGAAAATSNVQTICYGGRNFSSAGGPYIIDKAIVHSPNDRAFTTAGSQTPTLKLRGHTSAPSSATDGTELGSTTGAASGSSQAVTITSTDNVNAWNYVWFTIAIGSADNIYVAESYFYKLS